MSGCDVLFRRFFAPWYPVPPGGSPPGLTRPDLEIHPDSAGLSAADAFQMSQEHQRERASQVARMIAAARDDWPTYLAVDQAVSLSTIDAFDAHWTRERIARTIRSSDPSDFTNDYLVICCELGAVLGEVMRQQLPGLEWVYSDPYWESSLWYAPTGGRIYPFHWSIKKMSSCGGDDGLSEKLHAGIDSIQRPEPSG